MIKGDINFENFKMDKKCQNEEKASLPQRKENHDVLKKEAINASLSDHTARTCKIYIPNKMQKRFTP